MGRMGGMVGGEMRERSGDYLKGEREREGSRFDE